MVEIADRMTRGGSEEGWSEAGAPETVETSPVLAELVAGRGEALVVTTEVEEELIRPAMQAGRAVVLPRRADADTAAPPSRDLTRASAVLKALDHLGLGLVLINRQGYVTDFNEAGSELLGIDHTASWQERHVSNLMTVFPGDVYDQVDQMLSGSRGVVRREITVPTSSGRLAAVTLCALPVGGERSAEIVGIVRSADTVLEQTRRTEHELTILAEVAAALSSSLDLKQILRIILTGATASQGLGFNRAFLFLYDRYRHELTAHMAVGPTSAEEAGRIWTQLAGMQLSLGQLLDVHPTGGEESGGGLFAAIEHCTLSLDSDSVLARICDTGAGMHVDASAELDPLTAGLLRRIGSGSAALVPLMSKGRCQGLLAADNAITGAPISADAVRMLKVLADHAAVAIQRARLYEDQRQRTRELERTYRRLEASQEQVVRSEKMSVMGEVTSAVAEDLRNPLTIIGGFVNLLGDILPPQHGEYLNIIASEIGRAEEMLAQVVEFARASSRHNQVFDYSVLTANTLEKFRGKHENRAHTINLSTAAERLPVYGNLDQLGFALYQLLQLVTEAAEEIRVEMRTEQREEQARLTIAFAAGEGKRHRLMRSLEQLFSRQTSSPRLQVLVAGETIKYHGGSYRLTTTDCGQPLLILDIPLVREAGERA